MSNRGSFLWLPRRSWQRRRSEPGAQLFEGLRIRLTLWYCGVLGAALVLFGIGFGNATSLPPLIAQTEFVAADVTRVVALIVGVSQATYAFAPAAFGLIRALAPHTAGAAAGAAPGLFAAAALAQGLAIGAFLAGRR